MSQRHKYNPLFIAFINMTMIFDVHIVVSTVGMVYMVVYNSIARIVVGMICIYGIVESIISMSMIFHIYNICTPPLQYTHTYTHISTIINTHNVHVYGCHALRGW